MNWILAAAAPALVGFLLVATGRVLPTILGYHLFCAAILWPHRARVRAWLRRDRRTLRWIVGTALPVVAVLLAAPLVASPAPYRELFLETLFPGGAYGWQFPVFAAYSLLVHALLEELAWRAAITDPERAGPGAAAAGNAVFFGLLHAAPLGIVLGWTGLLAGIPTGAAGAAGAFWALATWRSRSLWPALLSHIAADAVILAGIWFFFIR